LTTSAPRLPRSSGGDHALRAALLVVDLQRDFCPGGALAVKDGDSFVPKVNKVIAAFERASLPVFFTRDWHPPNHVSFRGRGGIWPPHCVQGTPGAGFHPSLKLPLDAVIVSKGDDPGTEAYSGFQGTDLEARLKQLKVAKVVLCGLATDYCVKETARDARRARFAVDVMRDCIRAVNAKAGDGEKAVSAMRRMGAKFTTSTAVARKLESAEASP